MAARELISGGSPEQIEARFPKLNDSQIAGLAAFGQQRDAQPHEVILERGDLHHGIFVVLSGRIEVLRVSAEGETVLHVLDRGQFTGDVNLLSGRGTLIRAKALVGRFLNSIAIPAVVQYAIAIPLLGGHWRCPLSVDVPG